ncbi:histidyl-tRNA synthetase [Candidatus Arthromitus sp. SFB-mouse-Japan]|uniref:histidine--tRNA ligase n=1 Tax=unclassified Candidatus Neoarthromitus TaxID=2638829 RepID=UPI00021B7D51|nr:MULTISPECIES: histidine--tRNA ligase [unclassified Candidatus Arthromitus]EIA24473.1 Histidyl-tRNA synthetase [Candidatus Arthromitus sp. SFB-1]EIA26343.1 Histidyl-tRNA synthetase [Candidatus Arthromitus sp. SFB-3]EIA27604.1 Histidyl-tRNA synthetase [Candidatus Arthromitus sp. SFB-4]EIA27755.1 Histidyl-tRNA synthetase [Candidatus Arthromitus sp. SFB-co]EIA30896.1 Histidyl-tRNA synthetase [Candidatus Arthromitus sp. SFB-mouse-SU]
MDKIIKSPKGTKDCLPWETYIWKYIENFLRNKARIYGIKEIRTPIFEYTDLFLRGVGDTTDIVQKEMYTFNDKGNRSITLKAEGTAPTIRSFIEHGMYSNPQPTKLFYITPVFRYENVQKGRLRQHHQFGVEIFGTDSPISDAEIISMAYSIYDDLNLKNIKVYINSLGCDECRSIYNQKFKKFLEGISENLCSICQERLKKNPLRILDCKNEECKNMLLEDAPSILDYICQTCTKHFNDVQLYLNMFNVDFEVKSSIVRGLDYYTRTVFEIVDESNTTLCGGGRYNNLIEELGGKDCPAVGFGMGIERLLLSLGDNLYRYVKDDRIDLFVINHSEEYKTDALKICNKLRKFNIKCDTDCLNRSFKQQMKYANKINAKNIVVIGRDELYTGMIKIKNMDTSEVTILNLNNDKEIQKYFL